MSSFSIEGNDRFYFGAQATLIETDREIASEWAGKHILLNPAHAFVLGKFVEADRANKNQQYFALDSLKNSQPTIAHAPMNINHNPRNIVGAFVASEMIYPTGEASDDMQTNPYIESLGVFWKYYFPDEYRTVQEAAKTGSLFYSMECVPRAISSIGGVDDTKEYPYEGRQSPNYPDELNARTVPMKLVDPHFVGGALVIPPAKPGWDRAEVTQVSKWMEDNWKEAELAYEGMKNAAPHLTALEWEVMMGELMVLNSENARTFKTDERDKLAKTGAAMPDGSFPIKNAQDLKNAIKLAGRAKNPAAAKAHIKSRAKALGQTGLIPKGW